MALPGATDPRKSRRQQLIEAEVDQELQAPMQWGRSQQEINRDQWVDENIPDWAKPAVATGARMANLYLGGQDLAGKLSGDTVGGLSEGQEMLAKGSGQLGEAMWNVAPWAAFAGEVSAEGLPYGAPIGVAPRVAKGLKNLGVKGRTALRAGEMATMGATGAFVGAIPYQLEGTFKERLAESTVNMLFGNALGLVKANLDWNRVIDSDEVFTKGGVPSRGLRAQLEESGRSVDDLTPGEWVDLEMTGAWPEMTHLDRIHAGAGWLMNNWKDAPEAIVLPDIDTANAMFPGAGMESGDRAFWPKGSDQIVLIANEIPDAKTLETVLAHEAIGHYGVSGIVPDLDLYATQVFAEKGHLIPPEVIRKVDANYRQADFKDMPQDQYEQMLALEYIAHMSENPNATNTASTRAYVDKLQQGFSEFLGYDVKPQTVQQAIYQSSLKTKGPGDGFDARVDNLMPPGYKDAGKVDLEQNPVLRRRAEITPEQRQANFDRWNAGNQIGTDDRYHATFSEFDEFRSGNPEGWFGSGTYFTESTDDASDNYARLSGPDVQIKIDQIMEEIADDPDYADFTTEELEEKAAELLGGHGGYIMPAKLRMRNPLSLTDDEGATYFDYVSEWDDDGELIDESGKMLELADSIRSMAPEFDMDGEKVVGELFEKLDYAFENDGVSGREVFDALRDVANDNYATDFNTGAHVPGEFLRSVAEDMGYDGIVMDAGRAPWGAQMGINPGTRHFITFKPDQVKSAIGNRGTYDESGNILKSRLRPILEGEEDFTPAKSKRGKKSKVMDIGVELDRIAQEKGEHISPRDYYKGDNLKKIEDKMYDDLDYALMNNPEAAGWYEHQVPGAMREIYSIHPELQADRGQDAIFKAILAAHSNGQNVYSNMWTANGVYEEFKRTGKIPEWGVGTRSNDMAKSMRNIQKLVDDLGADGFADFMGDEITVRELRDMGFKLSGESPDDVFKGSWILGPKLGSFYNNMQGDFNTLTADVWFTRTWNRLTGNMVGTNPDIIDQNIAEFRDLAKSAPLKDRLGVSKAKIAKMDDEEIKDFVKQIAKAYENTGYKDKRPFWVRANSMNKNFEGELQGGPRGPTERKAMREVMNNVLARRKREGKNLQVSVADAQALLWYLEKEFFVKHGAANKMAEGADYVDAARTLSKRLQTERPWVYGDDVE